ncbi:MAG: LPS assembly lipoprotein LptE [Gammaproteobacteria bacterium]
MLLSRGFQSAVIVLLGFSLSLMSGCGFRLQGTNAYPEGMANTYIDASDRYTPFYRDLKIALEQGGINVTSSPVDADSIIRIQLDETGQRVLTVTGRNVPEEYEVYYRITYSVFMGGERMIENRSIQREQDYTFDATTKLGKDREAEGFRAAISKDLVRQVTYEIAQLK